MQLDGHNPKPNAARQSGGGEFDQQRSVIGGFLALAEVAVDAAGGIVMEFSTEAMFRGARDAHGRREIAIYRDESKACG